MTLNALRRFLRDSGCLEERVLQIAGSGSMFLEYVCRTKQGTSCRAIFAADLQGGRMTDATLTGLSRRLAPCLGRGWIKRVPEEDPFG
jgi:hypothetical protein